MCAAFASPTGASVAVVKLGRAQGDGSSGTPNAFSCA